MFTNVLIKQSYMATKETIYYKTELEI